MISNDFEIALRAHIAAVVRDEVRRALAESTVADEFIASKEAARIAGVSTRTIRRWIDDGKLDAYGAGRTVRVSRAELVRLLRDGPRERPRDRDLSPEELARRDFG